MAIQQDLQQPVLPAYIELFDIDLTPIGGSVLRVTPSTVAGANAIIFGGNTYTPMPISGSGWETTVDGAAPQPTLKVSNVTRFIQQYLVQFKDLVGARVVRYLTLDKYLDAASIPRRNLARYTESLSPTGWTYGTGGVVRTANVPDPMGGTKAVRIEGLNGLSQVATGTVVYHTQKINVTPNTQYTASFWVNPITTGTLSLRFRELDAGDVTIATPTADYPLVAGSGWQQLQFTFTTAATTATFRPIFGDSAAGVTFSGDFFRFQVEPGDRVTPYQYTEVTHQPYANPNEVFNSSIYVIEQKTKQNKNEVEFKLCSIIDQPRLKLPRVQVLRAEFPGAGLFRKS